MTYSMIFAAVGITVAFGIIITYLGITPPETAPTPTGDSLIKLRARKIWTFFDTINHTHMWIGVILGVIVTLISKMPAMLFIVPIGAILIPTLFVSPQARRIEKLQAVETWTRSLGGILTSGSSIEEALRASVHSTPDAIKPEVARLAARLSAGQNIEPALREWADEMNHQTTDMIAAALIQGARSRQGGLSEALAELAVIVSERVRISQQIEADRAKPRATVRSVTIITLILAGAMITLGSTFTSAYTTPLGQLVLTVLCSAYLASLWWLRALMSRTDTSRFLNSTRHSAKAGA